MKKLIVVVLLVAMLATVALFATACGGDNAELLRQIEDLQRQLDEIRQLEGIPGTPGADGQPGTSPHIGANGNWWIGTADTGIPARGPQGPPGEGEGAVFRIYEIGDTFTYVTHTGIPLFSIKVVPDHINQHVPSSVRVYITNHNMPGTAVHTFVRMRSLRPDGLFNTRHFDLDPTIIPLGETEGFLGGDLFTSAWFGWPIMGGSPTTSMIPYVIFRR